MNYVVLKIIAIIFMIIDHIGFVLCNNDFTLRCIGRLAFPIFSFLIVNGFHHTKSKFKYLWRLGLFAIISEPIFDLGFFGSLFDLNNQNVFFTLFLGVLLITILNNLSITIKEKEGDNIWTKLIYGLLAFWFIGLFASLNYTMNADYGWFGILVIVLFYYTYESSILNKIMMFIGLLVINIVYIYDGNSNIEILSMLSLIPIYLFKDKKVEVSKPLKYFFYIFYPLHILIIYLAKILFL